MVEPARLSAKGAVHKHHGDKTGSGVAQIAVDAQGTRLASQLGTVFATLQPPQLIEQSRGGRHGRGQVGRVWVLG